MNKPTTATKNWLRGGQIVEHNIRMFKQNIKRVSVASLLIASVYIVGYTLINTTAIDRKLAFNYYFSSVIAYVAKPTGINHITYNNQPIKLSHGQVLQSGAFIRASNKIQTLLIESSRQGVALVILVYFLLSLYIRKRGRQAQADKFLRGGSLVDNKQFLKNLHNKHIHRDLSLGSIPILKNKEVQHFEISGTSGTGKSTTFNHLIASIKKRGDRALIYSSSTEFITSFYHPDKDIILNPLDDRFPGWSVWNEIQAIYHYDDVAAALIPDVENGQNDPIWTNAARLLFADVARKLKQQGACSTKKLIDTLLAISEDEIKKMLKTTLSSIIFSQSNKNKTSIAESVRFTLIENIKSLRFLTNDNHGFSIRDWVNNEKDNQGSIFVTALSDQKEVLKPLISCWVDIFASSVLSLPESKSRRIWLIVDELAGLHKLKSLSKMAAETRKYGGCVVIGYQNYSDIEVIYGTKGAAGLSNLTQNKVFFRTKDAYNAQHAATQLGREEVKSTNHNLSMGSENIRDSVSITESEKLRQLVLPTQIANLKDYHGFYSLPGDYPIVRFYQKDYKPKQSARGFIKSHANNHVYMLEGVQAEIDMQVDKDMQGMQTEIDMQVDKDVQMDNGAPIKTDTSSLFDKNTNLSDAPITPDTQSFFTDDTNVSEVPDYILNSPPMATLYNAKKTQQTQDLFNTEQQEQQTKDLFNLKTDTTLNVDDALEQNTTLNVDGVLAKDATLQPKATDNQQAKPEKPKQEKPTEEKPEEKSKQETPKKPNSDINKSIMLRGFR